MDFTALSRSFFDGMLSQVWQSTILFGAAAILTLLLRRASARIRYLIWVIVLVRLVVPPVGLPVAAVPPAFDAHWLTTTVGGFTLPREAVPALDTATAPAGPTAPTTILAGSESVGTAPASSTGGVSLGIAEGVFLLWGLGVVFLIGVASGQLIRQRRLIRLASPAPGHLHQVFAASRRRLGIRSRVRLLVADGLASPVAIGVFRPVIVLPQYLVGLLNHNEIESVLIHELLHIRRRDLVIHWAATLVRIVYFFHPVAWLAFRRIARERELAVDEAALTAAAQDPRLYGGAILKVASCAPRVALAGVTSLALSEAGEELQRRILALKRSKGLRPRWWQLAPAAVLFGLTVLAPAAPQAAQPDQNAGKAATAAAPQSDRDAMLTYARGLATGDLEIINRFCEFESDLDQEFGRVVAATAREAKEPSHVELVYLERLAGDTLYACFYVKRHPLYGDQPIPLSTVFHRDGKQWKTQFSGAIRTMIKARELGPEKLGNQALCLQVINMRFGTMVPHVYVAYLKAQAEAFRILAEPPYSIPYLKGRYEDFKQNADQLQKFIDRPWLEVERAIFPVEGALATVSPGDFYLALYLEARPDQEATPIPYADRDASFRAERFPCLTDDAVKEASVGTDTQGNLVVNVSLTTSGTRIFGRATQENLGRKLAIVVNGKVVSAPVIKSAITGGRAVITGAFTRAEVEEIARQLNAYRKKAREILKSLPQELEVKKATAKKKTAPTPPTSPALVGRWTSVSLDDKKTTRRLERIEFVFRDGGRFTATATLQASDGTITDVKEGTYTASGDTLTMTITGETTSQTARYWFEGEELIIQDPRTDQRARFKRSEE